MIRDGEIAELRHALCELAIAAATAELMLRETHPWMAQPLGRKVKAARELLKPGGVHAGC